MCDGDVGITIIVIGAILMMGVGIMNEHFSISQ